MNERLKILLMVGLFLVSGPVIPRTSTLAAAQEEVQPTPMPSASYRIITSKGDTFGYEILVDEKPFIRQLTIPGVSGANGFKSQEDAEKIAKLVLQKIHLGIFPPVIETGELESLNIDFRFKGIK